MERCLTGRSTRSLTAGAGEHKRAQNTSVHRTQACTVREESGGCRGVLQLDAKWMSRCSRGYLAPVIEVRVFGCIKRALHRLMRTHANGDRHRAER